MTAAAKAWIGGVITLGGALLIATAPLERPEPLLGAGLFCASIALAFVKLRLPVAGGVSTLAPTCAVDFLALLVAGPGIAVLVAATGAASQCTVRVRRRQPLYSTVFSVAAAVVAMTAAGRVWSILGGGIAEPGLRGTALPLVLAAVAYYVLQTSLIATAIALTSARSCAGTWHRNFMWSAPSYFASAAVAALAAWVMQSNAYLLVPLAGVPLYMSFSAYKMAVRRVEEAEWHARELAAMLAATQEALALASRGSGGVGIPDPVSGHRHPPTSAAFRGKSPGDAPTAPHDAVPTLTGGRHL